MTDDLVRRIDSLMVLLDMERKKSLSLGKYIEKLEAALRLYACESTCPNCYGRVQETGYCGWAARKALEGKE